MPTEPGEAESDREMTPGPFGSPAQPSGNLGAAPGLAVSGATLAGAPIGLRAVDGMIVELGTGVTAVPGDEIIDGSGMTLHPGFVNGHTHAAMTLLRGFGSDMKLQAWLEDCIWPAERRMAAEDVYWGARLAAIEMVRSGTIRFFDMYWYPDQVGRAAADVGVRAIVGVPLFDGGDPSRSPEVRAAALDSLERIRGLGPLVEPSLTPHSTYMVSEESLHWAAAEANRRNLTLHIHFAETVHEVEEWHREHRQSMTEYVAGCGLLGPRTLLAHACVMSARDYDLVAHHGATVVTNPVSNLKLANGRVFPYPLARKAGVRIGIGTDGAASNNGLDILGDAKVFALIQKHSANDPTVVSGSEALAIAQGRRSPLLGGDEIAVGRPADFILIRDDEPGLVPGPADDNLVFSGGAHLVDTVVIAGRVVMRNRVVPGAREAMAEVRARSKRLTG